MQTTKITTVLFLALATQLVACNSQNPGDNMDFSFDRAQLSDFDAVPAMIQHPESGEPSQDLMDLGEMLFREPRLSVDDTISCNSCHNLDGFGVDGLQFSLGVEGQLGGRNAPTVFHAAGHHAQFWDGRAVDVEEQALGPITNPVEMGMPDGDTVVAKLEGIPEYVEAFAAVFPEEANPITFDNVGRAIGAFERGLTHPTEWDKFLDGDDKALTDAEVNGLQRFIDTGCNNCHFGTYMGGSMFTKLGAAKTWPDLVEDEGRKQVTGNEEDSFVFKTPSLRLISHTGPYLHDGSISDLHEVVMKMAEYQNGVMLSKEEADEIVTFLNAL